MGDRNLTLRVLYLTGHAAEAELSAPIIRRLKNDPFFEVHVEDVGLSLADQLIGDPFYVWPGFEPGLVISPCDRVEMVLPTYVAFTRNWPIVRVYGGITGSGTQDDAIRHVLDILGHVHLVEGEEAKQNLTRFGEEPWRIHVVGITHLDDLELGGSLCPLHDAGTPRHLSGTDAKQFLKEFAVVLMNPVTISRDQTVRDVQAALEMVEKWMRNDLVGRYVFLFPPNGDLYSDEVETLLNKWHHAQQLPSVWKFDRVPREQFLGLLSDPHCALFVSNSSSAVYEAPILAPKATIYNPSWRNAERTRPPPLELGGSDRIIEVLKGIDWADPNILRKRFRY